MRGWKFPHNQDKELEACKMMLALLLAPSLEVVLRFYMSCRLCPALILRASSTAIDKTLLQMQSFRKHVAQLTPRFGFSCSLLET